MTDSTRTSIAAVHPYVDQRSQRPAAAGCRAVPTCTVLMDFLFPTKAKYMMIYGAVELILASGQRSRQQYRTVVGELRGESAQAIMPPAEG